MMDFEENRCRLCSGVFCCKICRAHHEEQTHNVNPECEICIYGRTTVKEASVPLLNHIKATHWPLRCVFCKKVFQSLDDLIPHDKCPFRLANLKMQGTPKTPIGHVTEGEQSSPEMTPFYKCIKTQQLGPGEKLVTSTPLLHNEEGQSTDKNTPINQSQISYPYKSNLKLTASSNLSDSKKSDRRVTFSETPSVSEPSKTSKSLPLTKQIDEREEETLDTDDSYASVEEYKTAPITCPVFEYPKENSGVEDLILESDNTGGTSMWESALTNLDFNASNVLPVTQTSNPSFNVSLQINMFDNRVQTIDNSDSNYCDENLYYQNRSTNLWSSMRSMMKSVVSNISMKAQNSFSSASLKRLQPDNEAADVPSLKRIKLTEIKCRRAIREIDPSYEIQAIKPRYVDKATQTDQCWM